MKFLLFFPVMLTITLTSFAQSTWINPGVTQERFNLYVQACQNNAQLAIARQPDIFRRLQVEQQGLRRLTISGTPYEEAALGLAAQRSRKVNQA